MAWQDIVGFQITDTAIEKFWAHGIGADQVEAVLDHHWIVIRNRSERAAPYVLLGRDHQGRCLAIPIVPAYDGIWRPVTVWYCMRNESARLRQGRSIMEEHLDYEALQQPLDDDERMLMDSDTWDWDASEVGRTVGKRGVIFSMEFSPYEHHLLADVAYGQRITPHEFIKRVALAAARDGVQIAALNQPNTAIAR